MTTSERILRLLAVLYIAAIPLDELQIGGVASATALVGLLLIISWLVTLLGRRDREPADATRWLPVMVTGALTVMALLSITWSIEPSLSTTISRSYIGLLLVVPALAAGIRLIGPWAPVPFVVSATIIGIMTFANYRAGITGGGLGSRGTALALNQNQVGLMLSVAAAFAFVHAPTLSGWKRIAMYVMTVIPLLGMLSTGSRTGLIAMVAMLIAAPFLTLQISQAHRLRSILVTVGLLAGLAAIGWTLRDLFPARLQDTLTNLRAGDYTGRNEFWDIAFANSDMWLPFGVGAGASSSFMSLFYLGARTMHNTYIQLGVELGYVGILIAVALFASIIIAARRSPFRAYVLLGTIPFLIYSLSTSLDTFKLLWMLPAFAAVRSFRQEKASDDQVERARSAAPVGRARSRRARVRSAARTRGRSGPRDRLRPARGVSARTGRSDAARLPS